MINVTLSMEGMVNLKLKTLQKGYNAQLLSKGYNCTNTFEKAS